MKEATVSPTPSGHALGEVGAGLPGVRWTVPLPAPTGQLLASSSGILNTKPKNYQLIQATDKRSLVCL